MRPKALGRGLSGLLTRTDPTAPPLPVPTPAAIPAGSPAPLEAQAGTTSIPVGQIRPNPYQPRARFSEDALQELMASIKEHGVLQPIVVRASGTGYEVVAGERRLRAAKALGMPSIPALVRDATDEEMQTLALVENVQREDLNAMEKARALRAMMGNFGLGQDEVASRVGKARSTIANILRLLDLPEEIQRLVEEGALTGAHARALLLAKSTERRLTLAQQVVEEGLSVREVERRAQLPTGGMQVPPRRRPDPFVEDLATRLQRALSTQVRIVPRGKGGRIEIRYADAAQLDRLLELLKA
jgi:ParB family chromosome partitioning protein